MHRSVPMAQQVAGGECGWPELTGRAGGRMGYPLGGGGLETGDLRGKVAAEEGTHRRWM